MAVMVSMKYALLACAPLVASGADSSKPHFHGPLRAPFEPTEAIAPPLGSAELAKLAEGGIVTVSTNTGGQGLGCAVEDIAAPPEVVWSQLLTFETYPDKVPKVRTCTNYEVSKTSAQELMKTKYVVGIVPGMSMEYYLHHVFHPKQHLHQTFPLQSWL